MATSYLHLEDGTMLQGASFGYVGEAEGEVVFSTGMTGYPQSLTDPSFAGQILVFTYPLIGNYGVPERKMQDTHLVSNFESENVWVKGVVVADYSSHPCHYQSVLSLSHWLTGHKVPAITGIDTRALTQKLREKGVMQGRITIKASKKDIEPDDTDVVEESSIKKQVIYKPKKPNNKHIALIDCGVKHGIIRALLANGYKVTRVPYDVDPTMMAHIDGVVCSNGPGDPKWCGKTIGNIKRTIDANIPFLGICLGHQLLARAVGADTYKLKYGHRGLNQPCLDVTTNKAYVTSQNHGFAVNRETIPHDFEEWFVNCNDKTNEGIRHRSKKIASIQFHPEGNPGPFDTDWIFSFL